MFSKHDPLQGHDDALRRPLAGWICDILDAPAVIERVRGQVAGLCATFPVYAD